VSFQLSNIRKRTPPLQLVPLVNGCDPTTRDGLIAPLHPLVIACHGFEASLGCQRRFERAFPEPSVAEEAQT